MRRLNILPFIAVPALMMLCGQLLAQDRDRTAYLDSLLHSVYMEDQGVRLRTEAIAVSADPDSILAYAQAMAETDLRCQAAVFPILDSIGIPDGLSDTSYSALFLVVQHSDQEHQKKYYPLFEEGVRKGLIEPSDAATMLDRILMHDGKPQVYGTQTFSRMVTVMVTEREGGKDKGHEKDKGSGNAGENRKAGERGKPDDGSGTAQPAVPDTYLWPVENADSLDIRRAKVGLPPIETYIGIFREMGMELVWDREMTVEEATKIKTGNSGN